MIRKPLMVALVAAAGATIGGCGATQSRTVTGGASTADWVTHVNPVKLLPLAGEVTSVLRHAATPHRHDQALNVTTVNASFGPASSAAMNLASGAAELSATGPSGAQLYTQLFVFKTLHGARSLSAAFLARTRLGQADQLTSGAPGEQGQASRQAYGNDDVSYRYAFREQNVLCLVEVDGPRGKYTLADALTVAAWADRHIDSAVT